MNTTTVVPILTPDAVLAEASDDLLLDSLLVLTHRVHGLSTSNSPDAKGRIADLRSQRSMVRVEVLRRMRGGAR